MHSSAKSLSGLEEYLAYVRQKLVREPLLDVALAGLAQAGASEDRPDEERAPFFIPPHLSRLPDEGAAPRAEPAGLFGERPARIPALDVLPAEGFTLVLGAPGAGKSALLRWLLWCLSARGAGPPQGAVPVLIEARRLANGDLCAYAEAAFGPHGLTDVRGLSAAGRIFWLIDGLDEIFDEAVEKGVLEEIARMRDQGQGGVITCRVVRAEQVVEAFQGRPIYQLCDLDPDQRERFITRFCGAVYQDPAERQARQRRLTQAIAQSEALADLCRSPLLLGLCCLLSHGELPRRRHQIYRRAVELLAGRWATGKGLPEDEDEEVLDLDDKVRFLRELALHMYPRTEIEGPALFQFARGYLIEDEGLSAEAAEERALALLGTLLARDGVLSFGGTGPDGMKRFCFLHKTFLEYLTAEALRTQFAGQGLADIDLGRVFAGRIRRWDEIGAEVLSLLCGLLGADRPELVMELLQEMLPDAPPDYGFLARAVRGLAEVRQLGREPLRSFALGLMALIQHESRWILEGGSPSDIVSALRVFGPRWPEPERWAAWGLGARVKDAGQRGEIYRAMIAASPDAKRVDLLCQLLAREEEDWISLSWALSEAGLKGPFSKEDQGRILEAAPPAIRERVEFSLHLAGPKEAERTYFMEKARSGTEREGALWWLLQHAVDQPEVQTLMRALLGDPDLAVRLLAARAVAEAGDVAAALPALEQVIRAEAGPQVGQPLYHAAELARRDPRVLAWLCRLAQDPSLGTTREQVVGRLLSQGLCTQPPVRALLRDLVANEKDDEVRLAALRGLPPDEIPALRGQKASIQRWLRRALEGGNPRQEAWVILDLLYAISDPRPWLIQWFDASADPSKERTFLAHHLAYPRQGEEPYEGALRYLRTLARDPSADLALRLRAMRTLQRVQDPSLPDIVVALARETIRARRRWPELSLLSTYVTRPRRGPADRGWLDVLAEALTATDNQQERVTLAEQLHQAGDPRGREALIALAAPEAQVPAWWRMQAALALDDSPEARLRLLASMKDPEVRRSLLGDLPPKMTSTRYLVLSDLLAELPESNPLREQVQAQLQSLRLRAALRRVGRPPRHRRRGVVSVAGRRVGLLEETPTGSRFTYEPLYLAWPSAEPVSLTLPLRPEPYESQGLHPFFENLLPEGWLLDLAVHDRKIDRADRFGLLLATCADCVGAAEIRPAAEDEP